MWLYILPILIIFINLLLTSLIFIGQPTNYSFFHWTNVTLESNIQSWSGILWDLIFLFSSFFPHFFPCSCWMSSNDNLIWTFVAFVIIIEFVSFAFGSIFFVWHYCEWLCATAILHYKILFISSSLRSTFWYSLESQGRWPKCSQQETSRFCKYGMMDLPNYVKKKRRQLLPEILTKSYQIFKSSF